MYICTPHQVKKNYRLKEQKEPVYIYIYIYHANLYVPFEQNQITIWTVLNLNSSITLEGNGGHLANFAVTSECQVALCDDFLRGKVTALGGVL